MAGDESKSVVVDTNADSKVADENAKTLKRALPQVWLHRIKVLFILSRHILRLIFSLRCRASPRSSLPTAT